MLEIPAVSVKGLQNRHRAVVTRGKWGQTTLLVSATKQWSVPYLRYMVIAWRINRLMRLGRTLPDLPADLVFEPDEWRAAFILNKKPVPKTVPPEYRAAPDRPARRLPRPPTRW